MRIAVFIIATVFFAVPTYAFGPTLEQTACEASNDCLVIATDCLGWVAVNKIHAAETIKILNEKTYKACVPATGAKPAIECVAKTCRIQQK